MVTQAVLGLLVLFNLVVTLALVRRVNSGESSRVRSLGGLPPGTVAPEFSAETLDGAPVMHSDLYAHRVALLFVSPTCKPCLELMPDISRLAGLAAKGGPNLVVVNLGDIAGAREVADLSSPATVVTAPRELLNSFGHSGTPHFVVVDEGKVETSGYPGSLDRDWTMLVSEWERTPMRERAAIPVT